MNFKKTNRKNLMKEQENQQVITREELHLLQSRRDHWLKDQQEGIALKTDLLQGNY